VVSCNANEKVIVGESEVELGKILEVGPWDLCRYNMRARPFRIV
jgi:hypothetical protein